MIDASKPADEAAEPEQRARQRYVDEVPAPSVITLKAAAAGRAVNEYLFAVTGLAHNVPLRWRKFHPLTDEVVSEVPRHDPTCPECVRPTLRPASSLGCLSVSLISGRR